MSYPRAAEFMASAYNLEVARGNIPGVSKINKFGRALDVDTGTVPMDVHPGLDLWVSPTAARLHDIISSDVGDVNGAAGAWTVKLFGLDANWAMQEETVTLALAATPTVNTYLRIFRMIVLTDGTGGSSPQNIGTISATAQVDGSVTARIGPLRGQTEMAVYTVPAGYDLFLEHWYASLVRSNAPVGAMASLDILAREGVDQANSAWVVKHSDGCGVSAPMDRTWSALKKISGPADVKVQITGVSDNNCDVSSGFSGFLARR